MHSQRNADSICRLMKDLRGGRKVFRLNAVRNLPVIMQSKRVGMLLGISVDLYTKQATDIIVACGLRGKRRIQCRYISAIAEGFILIDDTAHSTVDHGGINRVFAFDTTGVLIGRASDYAIEESSMEIQAIEIITGYLPGIYPRKTWIFDYECIGTGEILLPASIRCGLIDLEREGRTCVCRQ